MSNHTDTVQEPSWVAVTTIDSPYEERLDANSRNSHVQHRRRVNTGEREFEWEEGPAPRD